MLNIIKVFYVIVVTTIIVKVRDLLDNEDHNNPANKIS